MKIGKTTKRHLIILSVIVLATFLGSLFLYTKTNLYISPDETANAFFAQHFAETNILSVFEPLNIPFEDIIHPRSISSIKGRLVPGSFIGLPVLYGLVISLTGIWTLTILTPFIAALAVFAWYGICRKLFHEHVAFLSAVLFAIHPGWWYYSARGLMHNVLFLSLLIFAAYVLILRPGYTTLKKSNRFLWLHDIDFLLSGILIGLALFVRSSEAVWIALIGAIGFIWFRKHVSWKQFVILIGAIVIALSPLLFLNRVTYGSSISSGYTIVEQSEVVSFDTNPLDQAELGRSPLKRGTILKTISQTIFPFGIDIKATARHVGYYGFGIFWWMSLLALIGVPLLWPDRSVRKKYKKPRKVFWIISASLSAWLAIMYGSWTFFDNPDPSQITIANSYVRYWLPIYLVMTPFAATTIYWLSNRAFTKYAQSATIMILILVSFGLSLRVVFFHPQDGLVAEKHVLQESSLIKDRVLSLTDEDAVIIVDRADKIFFPYRAVVYPLRDEKTYKLMPSLERRVPLYYYGITFPPEDMEYLNTRKLKELGLVIELIETFSQESLYRIYSP